MFRFKLHLLLHIRICWNIQVYTQLNGKKNSTQFIVSVSVSFVSCVQIDGFGWVDGCIQNA